MMNLAILRRETTADHYLPYIRHADDHTIVTREGGMLQMIQLDGAFTATVDNAAKNLLHERLNTIIRNIAHEKLTLSVVTIRREEPEAEVGEYPASFAKWLDERYRARLSHQTLRVNDIYLMLYMQPDHIVFNRASRLMRRGQTARDIMASLDEEMLETLSDKREQLIAMLNAYGPRRLGFVKNDRGLVCSELMGILREIVNDWPGPMPLVAGPIGPALYSDRIIFGREAFEIRHPGHSTYGGMIGIKEYPAETRPDMFDGLISAPFSYVMVQSARFIQKGEALSNMRLKRGQMLNARDPAFSQADALEDARDDLMSGRFTMLEHCFSLMVRGETVDAVRNNVNEARRILADSGAVVSREDLGMESAFWAQLPGNQYYRPRVARITSRNLAACAPLSNYPSGKSTGNFWGPSVARLKTAGGGPYDFSFHVGDIGHTCVFGPTGSGKTVALNFLAAQLLRFGLILFFFDKDRGAEIFLRAIGGNYLIFEMGKPTGCAPFRAIDINSASKVFFINLVKVMLASVQHPFTADDDRRIEQAIESLALVPRQTRTIKVLREFIGMGSGAASDIGARLAKWEAGNRLGWVFDNADDQIPFDGNFTGFDITSFLDEPEVRTPIMLYLMQRIRNQIDGRRIAIFIDEFWKALGDTVFAEFIRDMLKVIRKQNGFVVAATQSTSDVIDSSIGRTVIEQCPTRIFFASDTASPDELCGQFGLTDREYDIVRNELSIGRFLLRQGKASAICHLDLAGEDDALAVLSGRTESLPLMEDAIARCGQDPDRWLPEFHKARKERLK